VATRTPNYVNHLAFVDDTVWIANSKESATAILHIANRFFSTQDIEINPQKTELLIVKKHTRTQPQTTTTSPIKLPFGNSEITASRPNTPHRYLGVWISDTNDNKHTVKLLNTEIDLMGKAIKNKPLTDKLTSYIIRAVLHPAMEYRTQGIYLSHTEAEKLDSKVRSIFRSKANISKITGSKTTHHPDFYGIPKFEDLQFIARTSELLYDLNSPTLEGVIARARMSQFQWLSWTRTNPLARPFDTCGRQRSFQLLNGIGRTLAKHKCSIIDGESKIWTRSTPQDFSNQEPTILDKLGPYFDYAKSTKTLRENTLMFTSQLADTNGQIKRYATLKRERGNSTKGRLPLWYKNLRERWNQPETHTMPSHQNKHVRKWRESTEVTEEIQVITPNHPQRTDYQGQLIDIHPDGIAQWNRTRERLAEAAITNNGPLVFYTDGSLADNKNNEADPIMGASWYNPDTNTTAAFRVWGSASSTNPEAKAALLVMEAVPPGTELAIHTDSMATHNMLQSMASGEYEHLTTRNIIKKNCWTTWERLHTVLKTKRITMQSHKVQAHSGDPGNDAADLAAKSAAREVQDMEVHNSEGCRFSFILKHRNTPIEENPRRYLKHLTQNVRRGEWAAHYTAQKLAHTQSTTAIDWPMLKRAIHQDGNMMSGFSSRKTAHMRSYVIKSVTDTLPTMKTLHDKWTLYDTDICPRCFEEPETNQHVWKCPKARNHMDTLVEEIKTKHTLPDSLRSAIELTIQGIPTLQLTQRLGLKIRRHMELSTGDKPSTDEVTKETTKSITNLIQRGHDLIWKKRCEASINYQRTILDIQTAQKRDIMNERRKRTETTDEQNPGPRRPDDAAEEEPRIPIGWNELEKKSDAYRCECGKHSLTHTPGRHCDLAGLIQNRAQDIIASSRNRLIKTIPFFLENQVLSWTAPRH